MSRWVRVGLALVGVAVVVVAARRIDLSALADVLRTLDPVRAALLGALAMVLVIGAKLGAKAVRSQVLLDASARRSRATTDGRPAGFDAPTFGTTLRLLVASHAAGQLAWGPLGFTVRTLALRKGGMPLATVARVHVEERVAEAVGIAVLATIALASGGLGSSQVGQAMVLALAILVGGLALGAVVLALCARVRATAARYLDDGRALAVSSAWALASSVAELAIIWLAACAAGAPLDAATTLMAFLVLVGAGSVPLTPAQVGVQESALVVVFTAGGSPAPVALAAALVYRAVHVVPLAVLGIPLLIRRSSGAPSSRLGAWRSCSSG